MAFFRLLQVIVTTVVAFFIALCVLLAGILAGVFSAVGRLAFMATKQRQPASPYTAMVVGGVICVVAVKLLTLSVVWYGFCIYMAYLILTNLFGHRFANV